VFECTIDQEIYRHTRWADGQASRQSAGAAAYAAASRRNDRHIESMTSCQKSDFVNRCILLKNNRDTLHPDPIWNDAVLGFFEERRPNNDDDDKNNNNKTSSDIGSVSSWLNIPCLLVSN